MKEIWKVIAECPDYSVSNFGRVLNNKRNRVSRTTAKRNHYSKVTLSTNGNVKTLLIHRLVALAFVDGHFEGAFVNHKDGDKTNNMVTNLEWVTHQENMHHAKVNELMTGPGGWRRILVVDGKTKKPL